MEEYDYTLGVNDKVDALYNKSTPAFGTGIGDRKVLGRPQFRWNGYKNSAKDAPNPKWYNGNYVNVPGLVKTEGYWDEAGLCGSSLSFWDVHQKALLDTKKDSKQNINPQKENSINEIDNTTLGINTGGSVSEGFSSRGDNTSNCGCKKFEWNWIILLLVLLIVIMAVIVIQC